MAIDEEHETRSTVFSPCRKYRYHLAQIWDETKPSLLWLLLNPSTADETQNDPTVERCERRARMWGYGGSEVFNIFAYRATDPTDMRAQKDPIGPENDEWIRKFAQRTQTAKGTMGEKSTMGIVGWGSHGLHRQRGKAVMEIIAAENGEVHALKVITSGHPSHPLYISYKAMPVPYTPDISQL